MIVDGGLSSNTQQHYPDTEPMCTGQMKVRDPDSTLTLTQKPTIMNDSSYLFITSITVFFYTSENIKPVQNDVFKLISKYKSKIIIDNVPNVPLYIS